MIFSQPVFMLFFGIFFPLYLVFRKRLVWQNALILLGSYIFYGWWDVRFLILIAISTAVDFICGLVIAGEKTTPRILLWPAALMVAVLGAIAVFDPANIVLITVFVAITVLVLLALLVVKEGLSQAGRAKLFLWTSVATNLGILGTFKYFDFFATEFAEMASGIGWEVNALTLNLILPVGISFYTFQTMSYTIDIYRKEFKPTRNMLQFAAFVSFFPQLVAGPIERARNLLPQFAEVRVITWERLQSGALLFVWGLYKKIVIADSVGRISDQVFSDPVNAAPAELLAGALAFTFQIYCDFSGYSDMARGLARMLGFELMLNFRMPYFSRTPSEFWQRWHISLSSWLRDYLYVPLGGNRGGTLFTYRNLALTMLLGGLWHGAAWTFIAWGAFHGLILILYRVAHIDERLAALDGISSVVATVASMSVMFVLAVVSWVFFRAASFGDAFYILTNMWLPAWSETYSTLFWTTGPLIIFEVFSRMTKRENPWDRLNVFFTYNFVLFVMFSIMFLKSGTGQAFIYFDF